jgi:lipoyl(octanoyl) transferase
MKIEIKKSKKPIEYIEAIDYLEKRLNLVNQQKDKEMLWALEHPKIYTAGTGYKENEILDKNIKIIKTKRGGKITCHGPGQSIFYFVIDLNNRNKDIRKFIKVIEKTIIETLREYKIKSFSDKNNIGIWVKQRNQIKKVAAIGIRIRKWIAYHGFALNITNNLLDYNKIIPCGIKDKAIINLKSIKDQSYKDLNNKIIHNFIKNLKI